MSSGAAFTQSAVTFFGFLPPLHVMFLSTLDSLKFFYEKYVGGEKISSDQMISI